MFLVIISGQCIKVIICFRVHAFRSDTAESSILLVTLNVTLSGGNNTHHVLMSAILLAGDLGFIVGSSTGMFRAFRPF